MPLKPEPKLFTPISHEHGDSDETDHMLNTAIPKADGTMGTGVNAKGKITEVTAVSPLHSPGGSLLVDNRMPVGTETIASLPHDPKNDGKKMTRRMRTLFEGAKE